MPRKGGKRTKSRTHTSGPPVGATQIDSAGKPKAEVPQTIVAKSGKVAPVVNELVHDVRKMMNPHTASNLKEKSYNRMKDYIAVAGKLDITHLMIMSQTKSEGQNRNVVLRIGRVPSGPTLHFHITRYTLCRQVHAAQKHPYESTSMYLTPPLVVLNNFGAGGGSSVDDVVAAAAMATSAAGSSGTQATAAAAQQHVQIMRVALQHLFPSIDVSTIQLAQCRRVVLCDYDKETGTVDVRHYAIRAQPTGISRNVRKLTTHSGKVVPNLGQLNDVSEFLSQGRERPSSSYGYADSDSEAEDEAAKVVLPDRYVGRGAGKTQQCAMKLIEIGPRMTLELFKVERGLCEDDVLYHKYETKTPEEAIATKLRIAAAKKLREERRAQQEENVKRKKEKAAEKLAKKQEKYQNKRARLEDGEGGEQRSNGEEHSDEEEEDEEDDEEEEDEGEEDEGEEEVESDEEDSYDEQDGSDEEEDENENEDEEGDDDDEDDQSEGDEDEDSEGDEDSS